METPWRIQLFGDLRAEREDLVVTRFATSRVAALLARLALFPHRAHPREELADLLWPDGDPDTGRLNLRVALAALRRQMEPPDVPPGSVLLADRSALRLNPRACRTDVADFEAALKGADRARSATERREALDTAFALFRGELLPGSYDDWILEERERLNALYEELCCRREALPASVSAFPPAGVATPQTLPEMRGFPTSWTRFFGREAECSEIAARLGEAGTRLLTLTGPGGAGKTRLATEAARQAHPRFPGTVCFVPLADLTDARLLPDAVVQALGLPRMAGGQPLDQVVSALTGQPPSLLVLDNFEHLVERGAPLVLSLLSRLPTLTCLVTSRRRLGLPGEREFPVPPLPLPAPDWEPGQIAEAASVALFVDRAQAARPDFQFGRGNAAAIGELCRRLEGIPLAIELVAARSLSLTPAGMNERLAQRFELLTSRRGDKGGRHRSLWAAIAWSHDLLPPPLQRFFLRLSVFRGGCAPETAASVCGEAQALEMLTQLRERSLLTVEECGAGLRFRLAESLREFGDEHLSEDERQALARRHADSFEALAGRMDALWSGPDQGRAQETLDAEQDNLRAALAFCRDDPPDAAWDGRQTGLRLAGHLGRYWTLRGLLREGRDWLEGALAGADGGTPVRAKALAEAGWLAAGLGDYHQADAWLNEGIGISRQAGDRDGLAYALRLRGVAAYWREDPPRASADLREALALGRAVGNEGLVAAALSSLGTVAELWPGDKAQARDLYEEALALFRRHGDRQQESYCLHNLGNIAQDFGDLARAEALLRESLAITEALGDLWMRAYCLRSLGDILADRGDSVGAARLLGEGLALCRRLGDRRTEAGTLYSLAFFAQKQGETARAEAFCRATLTLLRDMGDAGGGAACLLILAEAGAEDGRWTRTVCLLAGLLAWRDVPLPVVGDIRTRFEATEEAARTALGADGFEQAWEQGRRKSWEEIVEIALQAEPA